MNPIVEILKLALVKQKDSTIRVFSYRNDDDFIELWDFSDKLFKLDRLIVVADGVPSSPLSPSKDRHFAKWVSAYSWATAFFAARLNPEAAIDSEVSVPRVTILDLELDNKCAKIIPKLEKALDFVTPSADKLANLISNTTSGQILVKPIDIETCSKKYWNELRTTMTAAGDSENHHDVSNQVGAMIMRAGLPIAKRPNIEKFPENKLFERATTRFVEKVLGGSSVSENENNRKLKVTLIDDRYDEGYKEILEKTLNPDALDARRGVLSIDPEDLDSSVSAYDLNNILGANLDQLEFTAFKDIDLLFLDLRLWRNNEEANLALENYREIARRLQRSREDSFDQPLNPCAAALERLIRVDSGPFSHRHLAVLPILIADIDPSLPIILFSSTQHRSVIQAIRDIPNIITDFTKPYIGGKDEDLYDPEIIMSDLRLAITKAQRLIELREVWLYAVDRWKDLKFSELRWLEGWPPIQPKIHPVRWLRDEWLPLAQEGQYELATALPWHYLETVLGRTSLAILVNKHDHPDEIKLIHKASRIFAMKGNDIKEDRTEVPSYLLGPALALIELLYSWAADKASPEAK